MRLVLKLEALKTVEQNKENNSKYFTGMHGWIYNQLKNSSFSDVHKNKNFKPFCFSNLYQVKDHRIVEGKTYNIILSSPNEFLIIEIISKLQPQIIENNHKIAEGTRINLGEYSFELVTYKPLPLAKFNEGGLIESENLVNITIKKDNRIYAINLNDYKIKFNKQLSKNLIRKYNYFSGDDISENFDLFENVEITQIPGSEKSVKLNLIENDSDNWFNIIGARYRFMIGKINETQKKILELCYDLGFGERNTFGFGFMNIKNNA